MAPTITGSIISREQLPLTNKLRKPIVEKIRRERINSSIEKLKSLLGQEFLKQQPDSRQEKADILEMTLDFLRRQQSSQSPSACSSTAARDGRSRCVQEVVNFLSQCPVPGVPQKTAEALPAHAARHREQHTSAASDQFTSRTEQQQRGKSSLCWPLETLVEAVLCECELPQLTLLLENMLFQIYLFHERTIALYSYIWISLYFCHWQIMLQAN